MARSLYRACSTGTNGLGDITADEALKIWRISSFTPHATFAYLYAWWMYGNSTSPEMPSVRTFFLPPRACLSYQVEMNNLCSFNTTVEVLGFPSQFYVGNMAQAFRGCRKLRELRGAIICHAAQTAAHLANAFDECVALQEVRLQGLHSNVSLKDSPLLSVDSLAFMVNKAANTSAIKVTLHPTAFARLTDELLEAASAKNITITTP